jgi:hypothetical protein
MIKTWLSSHLQIQKTFKKFDLFEIDELCPITADIEQYLNKRLLESRLDYKMLEDAAKIIGWNKVLELLVKPVLATRIQKQLGDFGEVVTNALLSEIYGYVIPIQKLRFGVSDEQSQPGTDTIAIKKSGGVISEMCYVESKSRTKKDTYSCKAAVEGYSQLKKDYLNKVPDMIFFVLARLHDSNDPLFYDFLDYINNRQSLSQIDRFRLGLVWEKDNWSEESLEQLEQEVDYSFPRLCVQRVKIRNLKPNVQKLFENVGIDFLENCE